MSTLFFGRAAGAWEEVEFFDCARYGGGEDLAVIVVRWQARSAGFGRNPLPLAECIVLHIDSGPLNELR